MVAFLNQVEVLESRKKLGNSLLSISPSASSKEAKLISSKTTITILLLSGIFRSTACSVLGAVVHYAVQQESPIFSVLSLYDEK